MLPLFTSDKTKQSLLICLILSFLIWFCFFQSFFGIIFYYGALFTPSGINQKEQMFAFCKHLFFQSESSTETE